MWLCQLTGSRIDLNPLSATALIMAWLVSGIPQLFSVERPLFDLSPVEFASSVLPRFQPFESEEISAAPLKSFSISSSSSPLPQDESMSTESIISKSLFTSDSFRLTFKKSSAGQMYQALTDGACRNYRHFNQEEAMLFFLNFLNDNRVNRDGMTLRDDFVRDGSH